MKKRLIGAAVAAVLLIAGAAPAVLANDDLVWASVTCWIRHTQSFERPAYGDDHAAALAFAKSLCESRPGGGSTTRPARQEGDTSVECWFSHYNTSSRQSQKACTDEGGSLTRPAPPTSVPASVTCWTDPNTSTTVNGTGAALHDALAAARQACRDSGGSTTRPVRAEVTCWTTWNDDLQIAGIGSNESAAIAAATAACTARGGSTTRPLASASVTCWTDRQTRSTITRTDIDLVGATYRAQKACTDSGGSLDRPYASSSVTCWTDHKTSSRTTGSGVTSRAATEAARKACTDSGGSLTQPAAPAPSSGGGSGGSGNGGSSGGSGSGGSSGGSSSGGSSSGGSSSGSGSGSSSGSTTYSCYDGSGLGSSNYQRLSSCTSSRKARSTFTCRTADGSRDSLGNARSAAECAWMRANVRYDHGTYSCASGGSRKIVSTRRDLNTLELLSEIDDACGRNEKITVCSPTTMLGGLCISSGEEKQYDYTCDHGGRIWWKDPPLTSMQIIAHKNHFCPLVLDIARRIVNGSNVQEDDLQVIQWRQTTWPTIGSGTRCPKVSGTVTVREGKILGSKRVKIRHCTDPEPEDDDDDDDSGGSGGGSTPRAPAPLNVSCPHTGTVISAAECELEGCRLGMVPHCQP